MSDNSAPAAATSAADLLSADPAPAADPKPAADPAPAPAADPKPAAEPAAWLDGIDDPELKGWAQNKNFPSVKDALASAKNLETLLGRDKVPLPKDENDAEGWDRVHKALGRPDEPAGYALDKVEGASPEFAGSAAEAFHKAGLSAKQATALAGWWGEQQNALVAAKQAEFQAQSRTDMADLGKEWGAQFDANVEQARRAARQFGIGKDDMAQMESAMGTKKLMSMLSKIGGGLNEDTFEGEGSKSGFGMSADQARSRLDGLMKDKEWAKSYINGDVTKRAEVERLNRILAGEQA